MEALDVVGIVLLACAALLLAMVARRRMLARPGGTLEMSLRLGRHWMFGIGRYEGDRIAWFRTFSLAPRPRHALPRAALTVVARRSPHGAEVVHVVRDAVIVECTLPGGPVDLAMPAAALPGFLAWLEAAPHRSLV